MIERMKNPIKQMFSTHEIVPNTIYSIGGQLSADQCRAWIPEEVEGYLPFQGYALRDGDTFILIDAGLPVFRAKVLDTLRKIIPASGNRYFTMTRRELDNILNLPEIVRQFAFTAIHCGGVMNPVDFFDKLENAATDAFGRVLSDVPFVYQPEGTFFAGPNVKLDMFKAPAMILPTWWFYEENSSTLFSSNFWSFLACQSADGSDFVCRDPQDFNEESIRRALYVEFDFLVSIDVRNIANAIKTIFQTRQIERICPGFGRIFEGEAVVSKLVDDTLVALEKMGAEPPRNPLEGWDFRGSKTAREGSQWQVGTST